MADLNIQTGQGKHRHSRISHHAKVDLTAMVDLGFLLITFFMLATNFSQNNKSMDIFKPIEDSTATRNPIPVSRTISLLVGPADYIYYYSLTDDITNIDQIRFDSTHYGSTGLRRVLMNRQDEIFKKFGTKDSLYVFIKPLPKSKYVNFINILDEIKINHIRDYCIMKPNEEVDKFIIQKIGL